MREPLEKVTASLMQNLMQIRKKNTYIVINSLFQFFGALGVESPHGGAMIAHHLPDVRATSSERSHSIFQVTNI